MKETNSNCSRNNPRKVIVNDLETALETENPSIYQAAREKLLPYPLGAAGEILRLTPCPYPLGPYCAICCSCRFRLDDGVPLED